nr:suppressor of fused domain protein [Serpens gallinarum]
MFHRGSIVSSLEEVWEYREETLYPRLFGAQRRGIFPLNFELFNNIFDQRDVDPRWLHLGVFEFAPTPERNSWLYVSSGGSTPWESEPNEYEPASYSWLGVELVIESPEQSDWPIRVLQRLLVYHVLACHGRFGEFSGLDYGHRVPTGGPIDGTEESSLRFLAIAKPTHYASWAQLASGKFDFLHAVGITEGERDYAKATSTVTLIAALEAHGAYPITQPRRAQIQL